MTGGRGPLPVYTFVSDNEAYEAMRASFRAAGFVEPSAAFRPIDGTAGREPYAVLTELIGSVEAPFFVLCHQDVRADEGHRYDDLLSALADLQARDPGWAMAGNAGGTRDLRLARRIVDPHGGSTDHAWPERVQSLDENFLVVRSRTGLGCSRGLDGFHLYATDLCLHALEAGRSAYVIDFELSHLSGGSLEESWDVARERLLEHWNRAYRARYLATTNGIFFFSRWPLARKTLGSRAAIRMIRDHRLAGRLAGAAFARY